jgi:hypothetical protein
MAKAIFTGEEIKKFSFQNGFALRAGIDAIFTRFTKNFFVCYGPGDASNRKG